LKIVVSGGGTGGHIFPALAIAERVLREDPETEVLYIGSDRGMETTIVPMRHIRFEPIRISGFRRSLSLDNIRTVWRFVRGVSRCKRLLKRFAPDVVIGTGGYVCGPVLYAAARLGIPTLIHEQNVVPGLTNVFLSRFASSVAVSFRASMDRFPHASRVIYTGNPRASEVAKANPAKGRELLGIPDGRPIVVIVGGSGGARAINEALVELAAFIDRMPEVHFVFITGRPYYERTRDRITSQRSLPDNLKVLPFADHMPEVLAASSLVVTRSGASIIAELTALGLPSIQIPSPNVTNNHQEANARWLCDEGAADMLLEHELTGERLFESIRRIMSDPIRRESMAVSSRKLGKPEASDLIFEEIRRLAEPGH
jgi:UDP-N-acetylglucosamine--N-acetylmuramyl-(pentapeptide) pyrophosphoryl-undecaprenol N-acetylglucosamine transferase